jgi:hypothetical protein
MSFLCLLLLMPLLQTNSINDTKRNWSILLVQTVSIGGVTNTPHKYTKVLHTTKKPDRHSSIGLSISFIPLYYLEMYFTIHSPTSEVE